MSETWDDYVATDQTALAEQTQDAVTDLGNQVDDDPSATLEDQLDVVDAESSSYDAVTDATRADGFTDQGDWESQQAQEWTEYAAGAAEAGASDLAENALDTAASYSGDAVESYGDADTASADASSELQDTASSVADVSTDTSYEADTSGAGSEY